MEIAYRLALKAMSNNEVPVGCIIIHENKIIGKGYNKRTSTKNSLNHAEIIAINEACETLGDWRLEECTLYVTVEPCPMCAGAIVQSRISKVVFGTRNNKAGCCGSILNLLNEPRFNHQVKITEGVMEEECRQLMKSFFKNFRKNNKTGAVNMEIKSTFDHYNFNVLSLEKSLQFYKDALGLTEKKRKEGEDGSYILVYLTDNATDFSLELTWLRDWKDPYNMGDNEVHLCMRVAGDYEKIKQFHKQMGCLCYENHEMGLYFINDPDNHWIEILPKK